MFLDSIWDLDREQQMLIVFVAQRLGLQLVGFEDESYHNGRGWYYLEPPSLICLAPEL